MLILTREPQRRHGRISELLKQLPHLKASTMTAFGIVTVLSVPRGDAAEPFEHCNHPLFAIGFVG